MTDPHAPRAIAPSWVTARSTAFLSDPAARVAGNAVATTDVDKLTLDRAIVTSIDTSVSDLIPDAAITDQKRSGRCWTFAGLNVLRTALMKELNLESVELSQNFVYFHDKLEKAAAFLARAIVDAPRPRGRAGGGPPPPGSRSATAGGGRSSPGSWPSTG